MPSVTRYFIASLPVVLVATAFGRIVNRRLDAAVFLVSVHVGLLLVGGLLLIQSVVGIPR